MRNGVLKNLVKFVHGDFIEHERYAKESSLIFFNNFAKWFDSDIPGKSIDYNTKVCEQV